MAERVYRRDTGEGKGAISVPSFTQEGAWYRVDLTAVEPTCTCPRYEHRGNCVKHVSLASAIHKIRGRAARFPLLGRGALMAAESELTEIARAVYAPVKRGESSVGSYNLLLRTLSYRHATDALRMQAYRRHSRVLIVNEAKERRVA